MYSFDLSNRFLDNHEQSLFKDYLDFLRIDKCIWPVFECLFRSAVKGTSPLVLRVHDGSRLCGAAIIVRCTRYGRALFDRQALAGVIDALHVPFYLWIKFGCCMDMMSNPGFVIEPEKADEIHAAMAKYLKKHCILTVIYDYTDKAGIYPDATLLPAQPHALIDLLAMSGIQDYMRDHKNIRHKINGFQNKGGTFEIVSQVLGLETIALVRKCFLLTAEKSLTYLPYQDLYLNSALTTSQTPLDQVYYFIARLNGEFLGYQAALVTGSCLNALHGAFDRERKTTYHAYDLMFVRMSEFALEHNLTSVDFGAVINTTKQRAVNRTIGLSYFLLSKHAFVQAIFVQFLKKSKIQGEDQMQFKIEE